MGIKIDEIALLSEFRSCFEVRRDQLRSAKDAGSVGEHFGIREGNCFGAWTERHVEQTGFIDSIDAVESGFIEVNKASRLLSLGQGIRFNRSE
jgi:hypothetical protein